MDSVNFSNDAPPEIVVNTPEAVSEEVKPKRVYVKKEDKEVLVRRINDEVYDDAYLVVDANNSGNVYLVPRTEMLPHKKEQTVPQSVLDRSIRPYTWDDEIKQCLSTMEELRLALYFYGYIEKKPVDVRELIGRFVSYGRMPVVK